MRRIPKTLLLCATAGSLLLAAGCTSVPAYQQQYLSKAGMTFSDSLVESPASQLNAQVEPGSQTSGGAQASGCSACR